MIPFAIIPLRRSSSDCLRHTDLVFRCKVWLQVGEEVGGDGEEVEEVEEGVGEDVAFRSASELLRLQ